MLDKKDLGEKVNNLLEVMERLRAPGGCPWDREQTMETLKPFIIEEAYELVEAIDRGDVQDIEEECGDLLLQVVFTSQLAKEKGVFTFSSVVDKLVAKLIRRHPHVFSNTEVESSEEVRKNWEKIKKEERKDGRKDSSILAGVPKKLPALIRALQIQERVAKVGFDWSQGEIVPLFDKLQEEIEELEEAREKGDDSKIEEELGDLLFIVVNLARHLKKDAEICLQKANDKFTRRFQFIEESIEKSGKKWTEYSLEELEALWQKSKVDI